MAAHPFDAYLAAQPEPQRTTLTTVAASLRAILPTAEECISYGMPAFKVDGTAVAGLAGFKHHCSYFPHSGATLDRLGDELAGYDRDAGTLRFPIDRPLPKALLRKLVAARLRVEAEVVSGRGRVRDFYDDGAVKSRGALRDGRMHGPWEFYRKDGSLMRSGRFADGEQVGTWRTFDRDGELVRETTFP